MRKVLIASILFVSVTAFCQEQSQDAIRKEILDLKQSLKSLKGVPRVDALNRLAYNYFALWINWKLEADSAYPFAVQAYNEAKKINYKRGLGYSYLRLGTAEDLWFGFDIQVHKKFDTAVIQSAEDYARKSISIGEQIKDNAIVASGYCILAWCAYDTTAYTGRPNLSSYINLLEKSISQYQKVTKEENYLGLYRDLNTSPCSGCTGAETAIAKLYDNCVGWGRGLRPMSLLESYETKAIDYYLKVANKEGAADAYQRVAKLNGSKHGGPFLFDEQGEIGLKKAISLYEEIGDSKDEIDAISALCGKYFNTGEFEKGLQYGKRILELTGNLPKNKPAENMEWGLFWMHAFYQYVGDYETALKFLYQMNPNYEDDAPREIRAANIGEIQRKLGHYDSAMHYLEPFAAGDIHYDPARTFLGSLYIDLKQYDKGIEFIKGSIQGERKKDQPGNVARSLSAIATGYYLKGSYDSALKYANEAVAGMKAVGLKVFLVDNYKLKADLFSKLGIYDSAYHYLNLYQSSKDSLVNRQFLWKLNNLKQQVEDEKKLGQIQLLQKDNLIKQQELEQQLLQQKQSDAELALLDKDNRIKSQQLQIKDQKLKEQALEQRQKQSQLIALDNQNRLKDQKLKQQAFVRNALLGGLFLFLLLAVFIFRNEALKRRNEKLHSEKIRAQLQQRSSELEMQALRAQMNPHFIFNCLSSINKFILKNESREASDYLTRFSRLIRRVLTNSQLSMIPLSDEIEMLKLYLDMERLRFDDAFDYNIIYANTIEPETIYVPPMLLQPFCENAIWHGLMHKQGQGKLEIRMHMEGDRLFCSVTDNGIGRTRAAEIKNNSGETDKSLGLKITSERLALFNNAGSSETYYRTEDLCDANGNIAGTRVNLVIKYKDAVREQINTPA